jgi:hypothetical protein
MCSSGEMVQRSGIWIYIAKFIIACAIRAINVNLAYASVP